MIDEEKASTESLNVKGKHIDCLMDYDKELSGGISVVINLFIIVEKTMSYHLAHNHMDELTFWPNSFVIPALVLLQLFDVFCMERRYNVDVLQNHLLFYYTYTYLLYIFMVLFWVASYCVNACLSLVSIQEVIQLFP